MEKLQAALERARNARAGQPSLPNVGRVPEGSKKKVPANADSLWQELAPFEVSKRQLEANRIYTDEASSTATPFDILRTKVLLQMRQNGWKRLAITSPMPDSGKTTIACNLALGLGRQSDIRSVVLDLDLRDPSIGQFLDHKPEKGIGDVLLRRVPFADQALRFRDNVAFSMAVVPETDPTRLLLAEETATVIDEIESTYAPDIMIFDLPSVLVNDDTRAFLKNVDCALIVARANKTKYGQFDSCEMEIAEQTNVLGVVLNAFTQHDGGKAA